MSFEILVDQLADMVAERIAKKLGGIPQIGGHVVYTTNKIGPHIPGKTRVWMRRMVKQMPGARKVGRDWTISAADYNVWAAANDTSRRRSAPPMEESNDDVEYANACIANAGYRVSRGVAKKRE